MANIKLDKKEFEKKIKLTKQVEEKIALFGTPLENVDKNEIEIEIFPDRPDLLSLQGYLRSFLQFLGKTSKKEYKVKNSNYKVVVEKSVKEVRPFTACCVVKNLKFDNEKIKEIIDIQEKLHSTLGRNRKKVAIGIYPLEKIKFPIRYKADKSENIKFIPLEMNREMTGKQILSQHPAGRDYAHLLTGKNFPIFVDANKKILSMPPIINSHETGKIDEKTKEVFIECSGFDFSVLKKTLNIIVTCLSDLGGEAYEVSVVYGNKKEKTPDFSREKMKISVEDCNNLLGLNLREQEVKKLLERMGYEYKNKQVEIPCYRTDVLHPVDIYEDVAIAYGYDNFIPELPKIATIGEIDEKETRKRKIAEILIGLKLLEINSYHLLTKKDLRKTAMKKGIEVEKSKTDYSVLRPNLLCSSLKTLSENNDAEYPQKIFEIGRVFEQGKSETGILEKEKLCISLIPGNFTQIKQITDYLFKMLDLKYTIEEDTEKEFIEGRCGKILLNGKKIGNLGEISPGVLKNFKLQEAVSSLEIDLDEIL